MTDKFSLNLSQVYSDLIAHFFKAHRRSPWIHSETWLEMAIEELDEAYSCNDVTTIREIAKREGLRLSKYDH